MDENAVAALAGQLAGDAGGDQSLHGFGGGGEGHPMFVAQVFQGEHGPLSQRGEDAKGTKARTFSPPVKSMWKSPVTLRIIRRILNKVGL